MTALVIFWSMVKIASWAVPCLIAAIIYTNKKQHSLNKLEREENVRNEAENRRRR